MLWQDHYHGLMAMTGNRWITMNADEQAVAQARYPRWALDRAREKEAQLREKRLPEEWRRLCPRMYRDTDVELLPNREAFAKAQDWSFGAKGLLLVGATRRGKTRAAWAVLKKLHFQGRKVL